MERVISKISSFKLVQGSYTSEELDSMTGLVIDDLIASELYLRLFLTKDDWNAFASITQKLMHIHEIYQDAYFKGKSASVALDADKLFSELGSMKRENRIAMNELSEKIRISFSSNS